MSVAHLTLRQLQALRAIYETGRISAAAQAMNVSQSATSVLLGQAEAALGTRLFDRTTRSLAPTQAMEQIVGIVARILGDVEALGAAVTDLRELERGRVRIAATPATGIALLPPTVRRFHAAHPKILLDMTDCAPDQFLSLIRDEKVDFGLGIPPADRTEFDWRTVHEDPLCLVCARAHPFGTRDSVRWDELDGVDLIVSRRNYGVRDAVEATLQAVGVRPNIVNEIGFLYSAEWMVSCGLGMCIFPARLARAISDPQVCVVPLAEPVVTRRMAVLSKRGRSLAAPAQRFVEMLLEDLA